MIKAIIFDAGGTYLEGNFADFVSRSCKVLGITGSIQAEKEVTFDPDMNRGKISPEECFRKYFSVPIAQAQMERIKGLWASTWALQPEMMYLVSRLKANYTLAILSNSDALNSPNYERRGWYKPFDVLVLSHELGLIKPDRRIYEIALERLGLPAEECLFIDDQQECLAPAKSMGMQVILYKSVKQLESEFARKGIHF